MERLFGIVQARFRIVRSGSNRFEFYDISIMILIIEVCFLLHNMIMDVASRDDDADAQEYVDEGCEIANNFLGLIESYEYVFDKSLQDKLMQCLIAGFNAPK